MAPEAKRDQFLDEIDIWPKLTFWYHVSPHELAVMPRNIRDLYITQLPELIEQFEHLMIVAASFPHLDPEQRQGILKPDSQNDAPSNGRHQEPAPESKKPAPVISKAAYIQQLAGFGIRFTDNDGEQILK